MFKCLVEKRESCGNPSYKHNNRSFSKTKPHFKHRLSDLFRQRPESLRQKTDEFISNSGMADSTTSRKKPLSLNDRHYRFLQDLSAPPKPSRSTAADERGVDEDEKPLRIERENRSRLVDDLDDNQKFSGVNVEEKVRKVKISGRRRLCKLSSQEDVDLDSPVGFDFIEPKFSGITDFDSPSPPPPLPADYYENKGGEIRDILNDLSSRLELLSVDKKREKPRKNESLEEFSASNYGKGMEEAHKFDYHEVVSQKFSSNPSNSLLGGNVKVENAVKTFNDVLDSEYEEGFVPNKAKVDVFGKGTPEIDISSNESEQLRNLKYRNDKHHEGKDKYTRKDIDRTYISLGKTPVLKDEEAEVDDGDDCVVLDCEPRDLNEVRRSHGKYEEKNDDADGVDMFDKSSGDFILEGKSSIGHKSSFKLQGRIAKMLYPHQRDGLQWLWSLHFQGKGGILGDDMGLGKTMQICAFLAGLFHSRLIKRVLVVAPKTLLPHWTKELSVVGLSEKTREYFGPSAKLRQYELNYILQDKGVLLTTYDIVRNNSKSLQGNHLSEDEETEDGTTWDYMILDEGHLIKNPSTQRAKSLLEIPSAHRIIISGTPLQNNLKELWALFHFCCPDLLGDKKWFKEYYECAILRGNEKHACDRDRRIGSNAAKELRERIQPYFLRRMKSEVFSEDNDQAATKLSKKNDFIVWLKLTGCQRQLYEAFLSSDLVLSSFVGSPLAALTVLKKICDHPLLLTKRAAEELLEGMETVLSAEDAGVAEKLAMHLADVVDRDDYEVSNDVSCKISFIMSLLDNLLPKGHNVLIFSQTRKMLNLIEESLLSKDYEFLRIDGTTKASDRLKIVNDFQEGRGASIFLLTSQVGGLGLTLTRADRVIVVDPAWNPSTDNQSVDRAYRIGQKKDVIVYRLMTCGTVEEKIYRKQVYKGGLFKTATEHKEQIRYFSQHELQELFSLPKEGFDISVTQQQLHEEHDGQFTMDDSLSCHIKFLETQGIAGVSHHNLLFSKTAPEPVHVLDEEDTMLRRNIGVAFRERATSSSSLDNDIDGARFAFNPKNVKLNRFTPNASSSPGKPTEKEIKEIINRLSQTLENKVLMSRLPDKGERIQKQIVELNLQLSELKKKEYENEVIDITDELQKVLNV